MCLWHSEIDKQCNAIRRYRWPEVVNLGDVRYLCWRIRRGFLAPAIPDVIWMSPPCQDLSFAGHRRGLEGDRSGLFYDAIRFVRFLVRRFHWRGLVLMEQVPGLASSNRGRDLPAAIQAFIDIGARDVCWTVLDAQYAGVAQQIGRAHV